ncbi:MAG: molybdenum cofactor guanylyltransferase MobA [Sneathiella sp.]|uniref:molybdenum cofactor guanylyltransferase MobA n=1 Tax=Sneathiella sp. TaxID=1964365 RepID=UPI0030036040
MTTPEQVFPAVLLAGGQSRRMGGGSKFLQEISGQTLLSRIISTVTPQVSDVILNINIDTEDIESIIIPTVKDSVDGFVGPLSGILTGLEYYSDKGSEASHMLSVPTDAPFIPKDLVLRLRTGLGDLPERTIVMAESVGRVHPVVALWPLSLAADLRSALVDENLRKILVFADRYNRVNVVWEDHEGDPFFNINRPEDLEEARKRLA